MSSSYGSIKANDIAPNIETDNQPCALHYAKTKDRYGAILDNLGCICKVLLSLNMESCCVLPSHASIRSKRLTESCKDVISEESPRDPSTPTLNKSMTSLETKKADDCSKKSCCNSDFPKAETKKADDCSQKSCCSGDSLKSEIKNSDDYFKESCCSGDFFKAKTTKADGCSPKNCCNSDFPKAKTKADDCSKKSCCSNDFPKLETKKSNDYPKESCRSSDFSKTETKKADKCSDESCCSGDSLESGIKNSDDCSKESCCSGDSPKAKTTKADGCSKKNCCNSDFPKAKTKADNCSKESRRSSDSSKSEIEKAGDCSKKSCCSSDFSKADVKIVSQALIPKSGCAKKDGCCANTSKPVVRSVFAKADNCSHNTQLIDLAPEALVLNTNDCSKSCCAKSSSNPVSIVNVSKADDCSKDACCTRKVSISSCSPINTDAYAIDYKKAVATDSVIGNDGIDIENGMFGVEHLILSIHGMTCTGCEKKLYRSLESLPAVSNIKTSLVLAQAEFDLIGSTAVDSVSIIKTIEKMTGFTCTKILQSGEELDMIVGGNVQDFSNEKDLPLGVTDLVVLGKNTIRITYHPQIVGARELISNPFFRFEKLAPLAPRPLITSGRAHVRMSFLMTFLSALLTIPVLILAWAPLPEHEIFYGAISLGLATIVQFVIAGPFYTGALKSLIFSRMIEMDLLIVISTTTAYMYSVIAYAYLATGKPLPTGEFFETSTLLVTLIMLGRSVSAFARQRAVESISIESLQTPSALLVDPHTHQEREIDARLLQYQDIFKVLPDTSTVTDGIVIGGETEVDESMITGEAMLITKKPGTSVVAGTLNHSGTLTVRLTRLPGENTIKTIGVMVDEAKSSKSSIQAIADRIAGYFVPTILVITLVVFLIWVGIGKAARHQSTVTTCIVAMTYAISALIVSCPCAIGLAVPMVVTIAGGVAATHGLIFKSAETIEIARKISHVIFDKTGTLTQGNLSVAAQEYLNKSNSSTQVTLASMILGLTVNSKHPVSTAITAHMKALHVQPLQVENVLSVAGNGIEVTWNGSTVRAGNPYWLGFADSPMVHKMLSLGLTIFCVSVDMELVAVFGLTDLLRPDAVEAINQLKKRSIEVSIVSGDNEKAVDAVARQLGIPQSNVRSRCSPSDKQIYVKEMLTPKKSVVMFCGDGTNDAIALAQASIGMHMNGGTDIAQSAADTVLMRPCLTGILLLIDLSRAFYRRVVFNFIWSFIYNLFAILLAAGAFPRARISPQYAGLGEIVSVLPVIAVAMQLKWANFQERG